MEVLIAIISISFLLLGMAVAMVLVSVTHVVRGIETGWKGEDEK